MDFESIALYIALTIWAAIICSVILSLFDFDAWLAANTIANIFGGVL
jgi:hypothetical protein